MNSTLTRETEKTAWINVPMSRELRKQIKAAATERDQTIRDFMLAAVKESMGQSRKPSRHSES